MNRPAIIAHRGASVAKPENTVAAFEAAAAMGADWVELDVRLSTDGELVVHHDPHYRDGREVAKELSRSRPAGVPLLAEALAACGALSVNVEIKNDPDEPGCDEGDVVAAATVVQLSGWEDRVLVSSFRLETIDAVRHLAPSIATAWLVMHVDDATIETTVAHGHRVIHPWHGALDAGLISRCHDQGLTVNTWTVDDPTRMQTLISGDIDGICTNVPDVALRLLNR